MLKRFIIAFVLVALVVGGIVGFNIFRNQAIEEFFSEQQQPAVPVASTVVEEGVWTPGIEAIGTVYAARGIDLAVEATGVVRAVDIEANDLVEEGDLLVQIDDRAEQADLAAARTQVTLNEQALERAETLRSRGVGAATSVDEARAAAESARAEVQRLQSTLRLKALEAPFTGTIGIPQIEVGEYVSTGTTVASLQDLDTLRVDFTVPEQGRRSLSDGQEVRLGHDRDDLAYSGRITAIEPRIDPQTRLVRVRAEVDNEDRELSPGEFVRVRVLLDEEPGIVALPQTSVINSLYGDYVFVVRTAEEATAEGTGDSGSGAEDDEESYELSQVFVQLGRRAGDMVEIAEGIEAGDRVVTAGQNRLTNGAPVTLDDEDSAGSGEDDGMTAAGSDEQ